MAYIKLTLDHPLVDGENVTFKAPCDCTAVTGLKVYYVTLTEDAETAQTKTFTFKDAHGNNLTNVGNLFTSGAYIKAILDTTNGVAYIQNADTNGYLENRLSELKPKTLTLSVPVDSWISQEQTITATGVTATSNVIVSPSPNSLDIYSSAGVRCIEQGANYLRFRYKKMPTDDVSVEVLCL